MVYFDEVNCTRCYINNMLAKAIELSALDSVIFTCNYLLQVAEIQAGQSLMRNVQLTVDAVI